MQTCESKSKLYFFTSTRVLDKHHFLVSIEGYSSVGKCTIPGGMQFTGVFTE